MRKSAQRPLSKPRLTNYRDKLISLLFPRKRMRRERKNFKRATMLLLRRARRKLSEQLLMFLP